MRNYLHFFINEQEFKVSDKRIYSTLADFLRLDLGLCGTKVVCAEGDCGACTVVSANYHRNTPQTYQSFNACITLLTQLDGHHIVTIEGLAPLKQPSIIGQALAQSNGSQCGYCTPGFVMSLTALAEANKPFHRQTIKNYCTGNLCRCTGYEDIISGALTLNKANIPPVKSLFDTEEIQQKLRSSQVDPIQIKGDESGDDAQYFAPTSLAEALDIKQKYGTQCRVWSGGTDLGVQLNKGAMKPKILLSLAKVSGLDALTITDDRITFAAQVTVTQLIKALPADLLEFKNYLHRFAALQIKNTGTLVGNIANASPIGDSLPAFLALDATLTIQSSKGSRPLPLASFFKGYKQTDLQGDELITSVTFKRPQANGKLLFYKVSKRRDLDISAVAAAFYLERDPQDRAKVISARCGWGGVAAYPLRLRELESLFLNQGLTEQSVSLAQSQMESWISPLSDHRGSKEYRMQLAKNLIRKCYLDTCEPPEGLVSKEELP